MSPQSEQQLLDCTIDLAQRSGWLVHHDRPARTVQGWRTAVQGDAGFPDLFLARHGVVLLRELKGPSGRLAPAQRRWGQHLDARWPHATHLDWTVRLPNGEATPFFAVWTPSDWASVIIPTLTAKIDRRTA